MYASHDTFGHFELLDIDDTPKHHRAIAINHSLMPWSIGDNWRVRAFDVVHDADGALGFEVCDDTGDSLVFLTDTAYCKYKFHRINILMIEANYSESILAANVDAGHIEPARARRVRENHMSIERVLDFLKANDMSKCRAIHLLHGSESCSDSTLFKKIVQESTGIPTFVEG